MEVERRGWRRDLPLKGMLMGSWRLARVEKSCPQLLPFSAAGLISLAHQEPWAVGNRSSYLRMTLGTSFMSRGRYWGQSRPDFWLVWQVKDKAGLLLLDASWPSFSCSLLNSCPLSFALSGYRAVPLPFGNNRLFSWWQHCCPHVSGFLLHFKWCSFQEESEATSFPLTASLLEMGVAGGFSPPSPMFPLQLPLLSGLWRSPRGTPTTDCLGGRFTSIVKCVMSLWTSPFPSLALSFFIANMEGVLD